ncbi:MULTISPECIES: flagellar basal body rod protein FlgB [Delftia]|jgi:flagellar basal-body rod protein FlgB|uniref:Flagellar basal body rod protein FlgB n=2 Tax=Delftia TaxID=80865 RepID=A0ABM6EA77_9BURK|nr:MULTISPECIES: flagellar basal body rod protein FlgB [Delftia]AOV04452.1 flagellar basal-body rod protein FlgB [Delftia tsuruhatensis]MDH0421450.1 flagellar basal body rod protein FlgB [Delftia tsuruhatensis]MDH2234279.1 flagellar basal body rod protein FlgB [Delftia tsuruhatensis]OJX14573.1 MAG: flagellar basal-body rod protein FlgB [Delftia sp. 67-8]OWG15750.1 flagellar basal-body rod protein FlgB [Delftia sp. K82]
MSEVRFEDIALRIRTQRLALIASNIANADTPGYQAKDLDFKAALERSSANMLSVKETKKGHIPSSELKSIYDTEVAYRPASQNSLDKNTVDLDQERASFIDNAIRTELAMKQAVDEYMEIGEMLSKLV